MTKVRDIMSADTRWLRDDATAAESAKVLAADDIGAVPVCDGKGHLCGMVTDRDLVMKVMADGRDPKKVRLGEIVDRPEAVTIGADHDVEAAIETMKKYAVRRLPVIDGNQLVGIVSQADIARAMPDAHIGDLVGAISQAPPNN
jgi:CBS domain-containing protein